MFLMPKIRHSLKQDIKVDDFKFHSGGIQMLATKYSKAFETENKAATWIGQSYTWLVVTRALASLHTLHLPMLLTFDPWP